MAKSREKVGARSYANYPSLSVEKAIKAIKSGKYTFRQAAEVFNIPKSTLNNKVRNLHCKKVGPPTVLMDVEEDNLVEGLLKAAEWGFPFTKLDIRLVVKGYLDNRGRKEKRFKRPDNVDVDRPANLPGKKWIDGFLLRHSSRLSKRLSENIKRARAGVDRKVVEDYLDNVSKEIENVPASNVVNFDETNLCDDPGRDWVVVRRGAKHAHIIRDTSKSSTSVMFAAAADGTLLPPYVVYKAENLYDTWQIGGPLGTRYNRTRSGWFDMHCFEDWFSTVVIPFFRNKDGRKLLIGDNLASHMSLRVVRSCELHDIRFIFLPLNSTHLLQPLDVAYFGPLKKAWRAVLQDWKRKYRGVVSKDQFPGLLKQCLDRIEEASTSNIQSGFRATGLVPFNKDTVLKQIPAMEEADDEGETSWSSAFVSLLKDARYPSGEHGRKPRKKKIKVAPGKSLGPDDFMNEEEEIAALEDELRDEELDLDENSPLNELEDSPDEHEGTPDLQPENPQPQSSTSTCETASPLPPEKLFPVEGDFVWVNYDIQQGAKLVSKMFVGQVLKVKKTSFQVKFMRLNVRDQVSYVFPMVEDTDIIKQSQIKKILKVIQENRGRFYFNF